MGVVRRMSDDDGEKVRLGAARLLSPDEAAAYLALGSRWAIYRLVARGQLPAVRLAGKLRLDRLDLDRLIDALKMPAVPSKGVHTKLTPVTLAVPRELAPPAGTARSSGAVTVPVTSTIGHG